MWQRGVHLCPTLPMHILKQLLTAQPNHIGLAHKVLHLCPSFISQLLRAQTLQLQAALLITKHVGGALDLSHLHDEGSSMGTLNLAQLALIHTTCEGSTYALDSSHSPANYSMELRDACPEQLYLPACRMGSAAA